MLLSQIITDFVTLAIQSGGFMEMDRTYLQNRILYLIGEEKMQTTPVSKVTSSSLLLAQTLMEKAYQNKCIQTPHDATLKTQLMDLLTPPPSVVNAFFAQYYAQSPQVATDYFYQLCQHNHSIKKTKKQIINVKTTYGEVAFELQKTVDNIAPLKKDHLYPLCSFCLETEGYCDSKKGASQTNRRMIRMNLDGESWMFHYLPDGSLKEHAIISSEKHQPMDKSEKTVQRLVKIADVLPHYFVGVDGRFSRKEETATEHAHYQAGKQETPLSLAKNQKMLTLSSTNEVQASLLHWPITTIRLTGASKQEVTKAAIPILTTWQTYCAKISHTKSIGTWAAVAEKKEQQFQLDLLLIKQKKEEKTADVSPHEISLATMTGVVACPSFANEEKNHIALAEKFEQSLLSISAFKKDASSQNHLKTFLDLLEHG